MDNLPLLRDIHLPEEGISFFPPAVGWWLIPLLLLSVYLLFVVIRHLKRASAKIYARHLLKPLKQKYDIATAAKISEILRRICLRKYPEAVSCFGDEWLVFLRHKAKANLSEKAGDLLKNAPFLPADNKDYSKEDVDDLWLFCYEWIGENL
ncbi:MAG: DUF4381 domain-containing protein [Alphaproteobacteria bacterium]|nr:DUF4381 domain-containing protein [Alphaproteobacteria bacterium]